MPSDPTGYAFGFEAGTRDTFSWDKVERALEHCRRETREVARELNKELPWEFDFYQMQSPK
ncbi:MAG: hypothetical protein ACR2HO_10140 [Rubrobacteraceae bacterium]|nr:hypothetical protein [Rubrobacter sp.]